MADDKTLRYLKKVMKVPEAQLLPLGRGRSFLPNPRSEVLHHLRLDAHHA